MVEALKATPRVRSIQRAALAMLVLAGVINYIDRATLAVANLLIRQDLGLSIADMGYLLSAFLWAYAFSQLPTGAMVDKLGPRLLLACGLLSGRSLSFWADWCRASASSSAPGSCWASARRRNFRPARGWSGTCSSSISPNKISGPEIAPVAVTKLVRSPYSPGVIVALSIWATPGWPLTRVTRFQGGLCGVR